MGRADRALHLRAEPWADFKVPELTEDEVIASYYMQLEAKIVDGGEIFCCQQLASELQTLQK